MKAWVLDVIACAACGGRLAGAGLLLACRGCGARYPLLADVPVVVPSPADYLAGYRDATLATLASHGQATRAAVEVVDAFAEAVGRTEPLAFGDDWVGREGGAMPAPAGDDGAARAFAGFLAQARGIDDAIVRLCGDRAGTVVEIGCGAGTLARQLATRAERLLVTDLSLRAVLRTTETAGMTGARRPRGGANRGGPRGRAAPAARPSADLAGAVVDADALALRPRSVDLIVAAELIDLLAAPDDFLESAAVALRAGGRLVLATPDPSLGTGDDDALGTRLRHGGWTITTEDRGVAWVRPHGPRHYQVYFADVIVATRGPRRRTPRR